LAQVGEWVEGISLRPVRKAFNSHELRRAKAAVVNVMVKFVTMITIMWGLRGTNGNEPCGRIELHGDIKNRGCPSFREKHEETTYLTEVSGVPAA